MEKQKPILKRLFTFAGQYKKLQLLGMGLSGVSAIISLLPVVFIWQAIKEIFAIYPNVKLTEDIIRNTWLSLAFALGTMVIYIAALLCTHIAAFRIAKNMRKTALNHIMDLPLGFFDNMGSGKLRRIINDSAAATETYLAHQLPDIVGTFVTFAGALIMLFVFDWRLGLLSLISVALSAVALSFMMDKEQPERVKRYQSSLENMNNEATEYVRGIPVVKTFNQSIFSFERFHNVILIYKKYVSEFSVRCRIPMVFFQTFLASTPIFLVIGSVLLISGQSDKKDFFLGFLFYLFFTPICSIMLNKIMWISQHSMVAVDAVNRIEVLLKEKPLPKPQNPKIPTSFDIAVENISFSYPNTDKKALNNVSLTIKEGQTIALVGASGGGKTTLATMIARFWDANSGTVKIGGIDIRDISEEELMKNIAFVFQNSNLYKASILDNVREGKPNATIEEVNKALKVARCEDIIAKLPDGINTFYGTKGVYLSGGEAQRIALARAILKDAPIILLDEATAFTDPENEHLIQLAFNELTKGKTVVMVAHRLSTVQNADCIYVIAKGEIKEQGRHSELILQGGLYQTMWEEYTKTFIWNESEVSA